MNRIQQNSSFCSSSSSFSSSYDSSLLLLLSLLLFVIVIIIRYSLLLILYDDSTVEKVQRVVMGVICHGAWDIIAKSTFGRIRNISGTMLWCLKCRSNFLSFVRIMVHHISLYKTSTTTAQRGWVFLLNLNKNKINIKWYYRMQIHSPLFPMNSCCICYSIIIPQRWQCMYCTVLYRRQWQRHGND